MRNASVSNPVFSNIYVKMLGGYSVRRALQSSLGKIIYIRAHRYFIFIGTNSTPSHALVDFGDDGTAVIPFSRLVEGSISNGTCKVDWSNGKEYGAALIITGKAPEQNYSNGVIQNGILLQMVFLKNNNDILFDALFS